MDSVTITLPKNEKEHLNRLAIRYGFSLSEFAGYILGEISSDFQEESFNDYKNPKKLKESFERAIKDLKLGRVHLKL